jgi:hypothetical protein
MENDDKDDEWPIRRRKGYPFGPWAFPDIDEMMKEMEKSFSAQFKELEKELPKNLVRETKSSDGSIKKEIGQKDEFILIKPFKNLS